ncbi:cytochrome c oxidase assembly protein [Cellulomonas dongxiuzhuiae]|uniref:Cytochrome c oxidase assembly protein n=1 Tax=Cellulomonas dongxiuzhuiae TaxID=2819979 RepID=A0ABX8GI68_9CELL|nr:cytochrome c oxidase assembly protein [Cellulomonas dongxiuzhuiae]MBO3094867.1 cytochrome c oxidase assembly protein [Cellulomonas dongxiuzhuiae]QWC15899.1 cytochrome c oxidase assembly protein [Cellulomonas dongxiuzhuiae]
MSAAVTLAHGPHAGHGASAWTPDMVVPVVLAVVAAVAYVTATRAYHRRRLRPWRTARTVAWVIGCALVAAASSPVLVVVPGDASRHMVQHLLLGMLGPLALVLAAPLTLLLGVAPPAARRAVGRVLRARPVHVVAHPVTAAVLHVGGMAVLYLTPLYALTTRSAVAHALVHAHFLLAGYLFAWALAGPDPAPRRPGTATRVAVLVVAGGAHAALAKLLYAHADRLPPGGVHTVAEVEAAAQWMYYGGDVAEILLAVAVLAAWYRSHARRDRPAPGALSSAPARAGARSPSARATC